MNLNASQLSFLARLHDGAGAPAGLLADARGWAIYRAGYRHNRVQALRDVYPVTDRLLGADCFSGLAVAYARAHPSGHADLHRYGAGFAGFMGGQAALSDVSYLPDVARLEWLAHEAFHAVDAPAMALAHLAEMASEDTLRLGLRLHPSLRLMTSGYPVHRIWQVNQPDWHGEPVVDLDEGGVRLAVFRDGLAIALLPLETGTHALARALLAGCELEVALGDALAADPDAEPAHALHTLFHHGLVVDLIPH